MHYKRWWSWISPLFKCCLSFRFSIHSFTSLHLEQRCLTKLLQSALNICRYIACTHILFTWDPVHDQNSLPKSEEMNILTKSFAKWNFFYSNRCNYSIEEKHLKGFSTTYHSPAHKDWLTSVLIQFYWNPLIPYFLLSFTFMTTQSLTLINLWDLVRFRKCLKIINK